MGGELSDGGWAPPPEDEEAWARTLAHFASVHRMRVGRLSVEAVYRAARAADARMYTCRCDCGRLHHVAWVYLREEKSRSCGLCRWEAGLEKRSG